MSYGSRDGAMAYIKHMSIGSSNFASEANIDTWLTQRSAILDGWLAAAGYVVPVTASDAVAALDRFANIGAAAEAELTLISAAFTVESEQRRDTIFLKEFDKAKDWIASGAPAGLGASTTTADDSNLSFATVRYSDIDEGDEYSRPVHWWEQR